MPTTAQFSLRFLLFVMCSCAVAFGVVVRSPHLYVTVAFGGIPVFWLGATCVLIGSALERHGDASFIPAVILEVLGSTVSLLALFTSLFYAAAVATLAMCRLL